MPNTTSPYSTSFNSAIKRGTPCSVAVNNIASRTGKSTKIIFESLFKAGIVNRQKFNGQWIYWANNSSKSNATNSKIAQFNQWQWFVDWALCNGIVTPEQLANNKGSQQDFMTYCKKFFGKQFTWTKTSSSARGAHTTSRKRRITKSSSSSRRSSGNSYNFSKGRTSSRRRAA